MLARVLLVPGKQYISSHPLESTRPLCNGNGQLSRRRRDSAAPRPSVTRARDEQPIDEAATDTALHPLLHDAPRDAPRRSLSPPHLDLPGAVDALHDHVHLEPAHPSSLSPGSNTLPPPLERSSSPTAHFEHTQDLVDHINRLIASDADGKLSAIASSLSHNFFFALAATTPSTGNLDRTRFLASLARDRRNFPDLTLRAVSPFKEWAADHVFKSEEEARAALAEREGILRSLNVHPRDAPALVQFLVEGTHTGAPYDVSFGLPPLPAKGRRVHSAFCALVRISERDGLIRSIARLDTAHPLELYRQLAPPGSEATHLKAEWVGALHYLFGPKDPARVHGPVAAALDSVDLWSLRRFDGNYPLRQGTPGRAIAPEGATWPGFLRALRASFPEMRVEGSTDGIADSDMVRTLHVESLCLNI